MYINRIEKNAREGPAVKAITTYLNENNLCSQEYSQTNA